MEAGLKPGEISCLKPPKFAPSRAKDRDGRSVRQSRMLARKPVLLWLRLLPPPNPALLPLHHHPHPHGHLSPPSLSAREPAGSWPSR